MENFIVSARKYRPASFATVVGQSSITNTLKNAIRNQQIAQAFLFTGPRGVGKTTCARIMAKTINCQNLSADGEACNTCESCISFGHSSSFNIYELDAASNNSVEDIRNLVDQVRIPPQTGKYKVYIIDEVHMLSTAAFNAFLKTLEEPPAYAKFILATTEKHKILPTILSRCQIFDFRRISVEDIAHHLAYVAESEHVEAEMDALHVIAQKADGGLRDALSMFDQLVSYAGNKLTYKQVIENLNVLDHDYYFRITDYILQGNISQTLLTVNEIIDNGFDGQHFITGLGQHFRNLLVSQDKETIQLLETSINIRNLYLQQSSACNGAFLLKALEINNQCDLNYKISNNKRLHVEIALMQLCRLANPDGPQPAVIAPRPAAQQPPVKTITPLPVVSPTPEPSPETSVKPLEPTVGIAAEPVQGYPVTQQPAPSVIAIDLKDSQPLASPQAPTEVVKPQSAIPAPTQSARPSYSGINIGGLMKPGSVDEPNPGNADTSDEEEVLPSDREIFTQADLERIWEPMASSVSKDLANLYHSLICRTPVLADDFKIVVTVDNKIQDADIFTKRPEILGYLRKELKNWGITVETIISDRPVESRKPYTDQDKFDVMAAQNPAVKTLKSQLNLDIEM
ncbi:MAG: DNA polymerase III subunit gamma/tau [Bacteroidetes bacterium HGW-Bacteroidetes-11]|jgi:DNA polymerase-3 subunit gamma/tau|nr:MAG: DNA polymerase III subunit gamma/tau [Bacteroidetes bacterium HGW-Bacteroidetes-11]